MSIYEKNLECIRNNEPLLYEEIIKEKDFNDIEFEQIEQNLYTAYITSNDKKLYLCSRIDPINEAESIIKNTIKEQKFDLICLAGFGLGYLPHSLLNYTDDSTKILIIEKSIGLFKKVISKIDISEFLNSNRVLLIFGNEIENTSEILKYVPTKKVFTIIHRPSSSIFPDYYFKLNKIISSYIQRKSINIATLARFQKLWIYNIIKNTNSFINYPGIINFFNCCKDVPVIVVGAGPSMNKTMPLLKKVKNNLIIIAVDSIYKNLIKNDIIPDFVVSVDPQLLNGYNFSYLKKGSTILITEPSVSTFTLRNYKGPAVFCSSVFPLVKWIEGFYKKKGELDMGGSVSTTAFDLACKLGGNPVILVGQDLSFNGIESHIKGSLQEQYKLRRSDKFNSFSRMSYMHVRTKLSTYTKGNYIEKVLTDKRLLMFLWWFEQKIKTINIKCINATASGAHIEGTELLSFNDVIEKYRKNDLSDLKNSIKNKMGELEIKKQSGNTEFINAVNDIISQLNLVKKKSGDALNISIEINEIIEKKKSKNFSNMLVKLDAIDKIITENSNTSQFISLAIQDVIHNIMEGYDIDENDDASSIKRSIVLYGAIKKSCELNISLLNMVLNN